MDKVKGLLLAGASLSAAVREALPMSLSDFAAKHELPRTSLSEALSGSRPVTDRTIAALVVELGGEDAAWRDAFRETRIAAATAA